MAAHARRLEVAQHIAAAVAAGANATAAPRRWKLPRQGSATQGCHPVRTVTLAAGHFGFSDKLLGGVAPAGGSP